MTNHEHLTEEEIFTKIDEAIKQCEKLLQSKKLSKNEKEALDTVLVYLDSLEEHVADL